MKTTYCTGLKTYVQPGNNAFPTGEGDYTTAEDVLAFFASVMEDFFPKGKTEKMEHPDSMAA